MWPFSEIRKLRYQVKKLQELAYSDKYLEYASCVRLEAYELPKETYRQLYHEEVRTSRHLEEQLRLKREHEKELKELKSRPAIGDKYLEKLHPFDDEWTVKDIKAGYALLAIGSKRRQISFYDLRRDFVRA